MKDILLSFWDKVIYFRENKTEKELELIGSSLPVIEKIAKMKEDGQLEAERAEILKRQILASITKFGTAGLTIPEIDNRSFYNPRLLLRAQQKLLVGPLHRALDAPEPDTEASREIESALGDPELKKAMENFAREFLGRRTRKNGDANAESKGKTPGNTSQP